MEFMLADVGIAMGHFSGTELKFDFLLSSDLLHFVASFCTRSPENALTNIHLKLDYAGQDWDIRWTGNCRHIRYLAYTWFFSSLNLSGDGSPRVT
ncbi:hypothetical protein ACFX1W_009492 [Malus domestica]